VKALEGVSHITIFVDLPVELLDISINKVDACLGDYFSDFGMLVAIDNVVFSGLFIWRADENLFDNVLDLFDGRDFRRDLFRCGL
jgi:hypothetical protein